MIPASAWFVFRRLINKEFFVSAVPYRVRPALPPVVDVACILALLYAGRDILQPIALAAIASLIVAPLIRSLSSLGLGRLPALLASLAIVGAGLAGAAAILATQLVGLSAELPQYHAAIHRKAEQVHAVLERPFARVEASLNILAPPAPAEIRHSLVAPLRDGGQPIPVEVRPARMSAQDTLSHLLSLAWGPIGEASLVLVLLSFILLEHESLQDRLVRLGGHREISRTIAALADATRGVSRFFFCQFVVNCVFGLTVGIALWLAGLPHALLWGALSAMLRFVPYVGALAAGAAIALFAAAVDPGWGMSLSCLALFGALELLVANLVEPKVYGHSTGLSPLAVVVSALFWGSLWGPAGLLISTPLTVCLVVAGRYLPALESLAVLLGEAPSVTAAQRFFQRSLTGDAGAIIRHAGAFLRRASFARYCDHILLPGLALAVAELRRGLIDAAQQQQIRCTVADLAEALVPGTMQAPPGLRGRRVSLLDASIGAHLRKMRELRLGRWQGSLDVPSGSIVLCAGLATERDDLVSELLVRALREAGADARGMPLPLPYDEYDPARASLVSTVFLPYPLEDALEAWTHAVAGLRALLPHALLVTIRNPADEVGAHDPAVHAGVDMVLRSFEEGLAFVASPPPQK
jgi:predicted PurR-regulated permease PerM